MYLGADNQNSEKITKCPSCRVLKHIQQLAALVETNRRYDQLYVGAIFWLSKEKVKVDILDGGNVLRSGQSKF